MGWSIGPLCGGGGGDVVVFVAFVVVAFVVVAFVVVEFAGKQRL